ncbi:MAG: restriction endonuclease subunit S [Atopobiaceae bacterium]|jgi:type I restriction enzyme S subunit|nr:restriction endonuclease subunit S [Atopobiaceae bacterium]
MRDSGIPWVGEIPIDWKVGKIKGCLHRHEVKGYGDATVLALYRDHGVVPKDSRDDNHNRTGKDTNDYKFVRQGDLVINKMKAWQGSLSVSGYEGIVSPAYFIYEFVGQDLDRGYADYLLRSTYKQEFERVSGGIREGQWDLPRYDFEHMQLPLPDIDEQQRIADYLDEQCAAIDEVRRTIEDEIEALHRLRKATIHRAVTKGLDECVPMRDSGIEWIGAIPRQWLLRRGKYLFTESHKKGGSDLTLLSPTQAYGVVPQSELESVVRVKEDTDFNLFKTVGPDDFIISLRSFQGGFEWSHISGVCSPAYTVFHASSDDVYSPYFARLFKCWAFIEKMNNITRGIREGKNISYGDFANILLPLPPLPEQKRIADYLDERCASIDSVIDTRTRQLERLNDYRKALIFAYVTGKKEVPSHE